MQNGRTMVLLSSSVLTMVLFSGGRNMWNPLLLLHNDELNIIFAARAAKFTSLLSKNLLLFWPTFFTLTAIAVLSGLSLKFNSTTVFSLLLQWVQTFIVPSTSPMVPTYSKSKVLCATVWVLFCLIKVMLLVLLEAEIHPNSLRFTYRSIIMRPTTWLMQLTRTMIKKGLRCWCCRWF